MNHQTMGGLWLFHYVVLIIDFICLRSKTPSDFLKFQAYFFEMIHWESM